MTRMQVNQFNYKEVADQVARVEDNSKTEIENQEEEIQEVQDSPMLLEGAEAIAKAIASGNYEKDKIIGRMTDDKGETFEVIVNSKVLTDSFFVSFMKDGKLWNTWEELEPDMLSLEHHLLNVLRRLCQEEDTYDKFKKLYDRVDNRYEWNTLYKREIGADDIIEAAASLIGYALSYGNWYENMQLDGLLYQEESGARSCYERLKKWGFVMPRHSRSMDSDDFFDEVRRRAMKLYYKNTAPMSENADFAEDMVYGAGGYDSVGWRFLEKYKEDKDAVAELYITPMKKIRVCYDREKGMTFGVFGECILCDTLYKDNILEGYRIDCSLRRLVARFARLYDKYGDDLMERGGEIEWVDEMECDEEKNCVAVA